jgi:hypothetical protein
MEKARIILCLGAPFFQVNSNLLLHIYEMGRVYVLSVSFLIITPQNNTQCFGNYLLPFSGEVKLTSNQLNHHNINNYSWEYSETLYGFM